MDNIGASFATDVHRTARGATPLKPKKRLDVSPNPAISEKTAQLLLTEALYF
jgi:hypothetical protein